MSLRNFTDNGANILNIRIRQVAQPDGEQLDFGGFIAVSWDEEATFDISGDTHRVELTAHG